MFNYSQNKHMSVQEVFTQEQLRDILSRHPYVVIDAYMHPCPPCAALAPSLEDLAAMVPGITFVKANFTQPAFASARAEYGVERFPTLLYCAHGQVNDKTVGAHLGNILRTMRETYAIVYDLTSP